MIFDTLFGMDFPGKFTFAIIFNFDRLIILQAPSGVVL